MKALIFRGPRQVEFGTWQNGALPPGHVRIRVAACGICGTDMHVYRGMPASWPVPGVRGHEFSGEIVEAAPDIENFRPGEGVVVQPLVYCGRCAACRRGQTNLCSNMQLIGGERAGGFAEQVIVPAHRVFKLPGQLDLRLAAVVEPLATAVHAFEENITGIPSSIAIFGAGAQGLLALQLAHKLGANPILISDVVPARLEVAKQLGATETILASQQDPVPTMLERTDGQGVDFVMEAAGKPSSRQQALEVVRTGGTVVFLALGADPTPVDFMSLVSRELKLKGTQCYTDANFVRAIALLANGEVNAEPMITHMPLQEGPQAYQTLDQNPGWAIKVLLEP